MARFSNFVPQGVIPATLLAFNDDFSINEKESLRHLNFVAATRGISAITVNGHASEVHACSFDEQKRLLDVSAAAVGDRLPLINGIYADGSHEAARLAKMAEQGGASCLLIFPPHSFGMGTMQRRPEMALAHVQTIADATDLPMIIFQYPDELGYPLDTLVRMSERVPSITAIKDWSPAQRHERNVRTLHGLSRPLKVLSTNSSWLMASLTMGCDGLLSGAGSVIADLQVAVFEAVQSQDLARAQALGERLWRTSEVFYADPFGDMHNRMKEALVLLGRLDKAVVRPPLMKLSEAEIARIGAAMKAAGIERDGASGLHSARLAAE
ncbi:MAG: dihydrodipicolinate synthase family protein [Alphaproteobacteria bacterium]|nr:dihydrodipicolinate synthase family protein [Alphaproteobacteria bacterium]